MALLFRRFHKYELNLQMLHADGKIKSKYIYNVRPISNRK